MWDLKGGQDCVSRCALGGGGVGTSFPVWFVAFRYLGTYIAYAPTLGPPSKDDLKVIAVKVDFPPGPFCSKIELL